MASVSSTRSPIVATTGRRRLRLGMVGGLGAALPGGLCDCPTVIDGARGVKFLEAAIESHRSGGSWVDCRLAVEGER